MDEHVDRKYKEEHIECVYTLVYDCTLCSESSDDLSLVQGVAFMPNVSSSMVIKQNREVIPSQIMSRVSQRAASKPQHF